MSRYTSLPDKAETAIHILKENFDYFENNFAAFMSDIIDFVEDNYCVTIKKPDLITGL